MRRDAMHLTSDPSQMTPDLAEQALELPDVILAPRTDAIYNAHGYLTKVPVDAILPYLLTFTSPGELVVDMFAGSGMTAVAAAIAGRSACVSDISVLGKHIGEGYLLATNHEELMGAASFVIDRAREQFKDLYNTRRLVDGVACEAVRTIWSFVYRCLECRSSIVYYEAMRARDWHAPQTCPHCGAQFAKRSAEYVGDVPVRVVVVGSDGKQCEQAVGEVDSENIRRASLSKDLKDVPSRVIDAHREMYRRSALKKWKLEETRDFFSARNALALLYLWRAINDVQSSAIRQKLRFAFTAILPRASRRYQWSPQRPLNAANQNYYIAPVYFEWNVFELFLRKVEAAIRSDNEIREKHSKFAPNLGSTVQRYLTCSATQLSHLSDSSVDYIFTDPPFGSNIFYSDMNLFQEAWIGATTSESEEVVIHTGREKKARASARYEELLGSGLREAFRVLKPGRCLSLVFGNSSGRVWSMVQRMLQVSGFEARPVHIGILDKGQRSVKGLASGFEDVSTLDLILTVRKPTSSAVEIASSETPRKNVEDVVLEVWSEVDASAETTPSHLYLAVLKRAFALGLPVDTLHLSEIMKWLRERGIQIDPKSGTLRVA